MAHGGGRGLLPPLPPPRLGALPPPRAPSDIGGGGGGGSGGGGRGGGGGGGGAGASESKQGRGAIRAGCVLRALQLPPMCPHSLLHVTLVIAARARSDNGIGESKQGSMCVRLVIMCV